MKAILSLLLILSVFKCFGQDTTRYRYGFSGELGGTSLIGVSAQYEYLFKKSHTGFFNARAGIGGWYNPGRNSDSGYGAISLPQALSYNFGSKNHFLEVGAGGTFLYRSVASGSSTPTTNYYVSPLIGYRSISKTGFQFRIYAMYAQGTREYNTAFPFIGIGFGKVFRNHEK